jgi:hypothetical protein
MTELKRIKPQPERPVSVHIGFWEGVNLGCAIWIGFAVASFMVGIPLMMILFILSAGFAR